MAKCTIISDIVNDEHGSSLVMVGMFVIAMGLLSTAGLQIYDQYGKAQKQNETQEKLEIVRDHMLAYFNRNGRFPCPAPLSAPLDDPFYGQESQTPCGTVTGGPGAGEGDDAGENGGGGNGGPNVEIDVGAVEVDISAGGIDIDVDLDGNIGVVGNDGKGNSHGTEVGFNKNDNDNKGPGNNNGHGPDNNHGNGPHDNNGNGPGHDNGNHYGWDKDQGNHYGWGLPDDVDTDADGNTGVSVDNGTIVTPGASNKNVRIGNIPTRAMNLPDEMGLDEWGNRIIYVVAEDMAQDNASNVTDPGGITIQDAIGNSMTATPGNVVLLLMSSGGDRRGAMDANGVVLEDCDAGAAAGLNCDADAVFTTSLNKIHDAGDATFSHKLIYIGSDFLAK